MEKLICLENSQVDIMKFDVENQVQVQENIVNANGHVENQVQVQDQDQENRLAIQIFEEPRTRDRQCRMFIEAKGRRCARTAITNDIYCCAHFSNKKRECVVGRTPPCGGITLAGARCKHRSLYGRAFCKKHLRNVEKGETSNSKRRTRTLKRKFEENCTDMVLVQPEIPLEINPVSVINRDWRVDVYTPISQVENQVQVRESVNELSFSEWLAEDEPLAVWFKLECEEKWHAGIKCARADWPLSIIRSKPTNDNENKYFVIFSLALKKYFWVDKLLVQSIHEFPQPIAYETHRDGLEFVQDFNISRQFIMRKLAGDMLHMVHLIHYNALIESAQHVVFWKQFGMEAYKCDTYSELGRMVMKLQNNIVQQYIKANWKLHSYESWTERCNNANSAETIELLQEELNRSILWNDIRALCNALVQPKLVDGWETWKQDVMKRFATFPANKCKICFANFSDENILFNHWMENHPKEAQLLFRGYGCALCFDFFANKKLLENHVQKRHHVQFGEHLLLLLCIPCGIHFSNIEGLQLHFISAHSDEFKLSRAPKQQLLTNGDDSLKLIEQGNEEADI